MQLAENGGNTVSIEFVKNTFELDKPTYHCRISMIDGTGTLILNYTLTPKAGVRIPSGAFSNNYEYAKYNWSESFYLRNGIAIGSATWRDDNVVFTQSGTTEVTYTILSSSSLGYTGNVVKSSPNNVTITIDADFPIFAMDSTTSSDGTGGSYVRFANTNFITYENEIKTGDLTHVNLAVNYKNVVNEIPVDKVWTARTHLKKNGSVVAASSKAYDFRIQPDAKIWFVYTDRLEGDDAPNLILHINKSPWLQKSAYAPDSAYTETSSLDTDYWMGNWMDYDTGDSYTGWLSTNIPIFDTEAKGDAYGRGDIGIDEAINGGDTTFSISTIGDDLSSSEIPTVNLATSGAGCFIYDLSVSDVKEIMSTYLYTDDASLKAEYVDALWLWGNNPIDFFIDLYYIPFSITNFYDTVAANLKFGSYQIADTSYAAVKESNGDRITLFSTSFEGVYGDWRDYTFFTYELYLPYVGFIELDPQKYVNKMVSCEMMFDITTHNLRYFIFADGVISDRVDGSVGVNIPLMATDQVNKAKHDRDATYKVAGSYLGKVGKVLGGVAGAALGTAVMPGIGTAFGAALGSTISSGVSSIVNDRQTMESMLEKPTESINGSFSSAMNIYDISYAYLKITEKGSIIPDKLHSLYGYPCYYMGKGSALSGYCELSDIRLSGFTGTIDEANALKTILREGVIL